MDQFAAIRAFVRAVELGSFSKVADELGTKVSTVSRYVSGLEADMGIALFNRSTRRLHLTEAGTTFYDRATQVLAGLEDARTATMALNQSPQGLLRINIPSAFGRRHIVPHLKDFLAKYPEIRVDATLTDVTVDLIDTGTDLAVRIGALADSSLIAKRLAPQRRALVACPDYLRRHPPIERPEDLERHECLIQSQQPTDDWYFRLSDTPAGEPQTTPVRGRLRSNDIEALLDAALAGLGVALLPTWLTAPHTRSGRLVELIPEWEGLIAQGPTRAIWAVYAPKKVVSTKVRAFLSFFEERFGRPPYWDVATQATVRE